MAQKLQSGSAKKIISGKPSDIRNLSNARLRMQPQPDKPASSVMPAPALGIGPAPRPPMSPQASHTEILQRLVALESELARAVALCQSQAATLEHLRETGRWPDDPEVAPEIAAVEEAIERALEAASTDASETMVDGIPPEDADAQINSAIADRVESLHDTVEVVAAESDPGVKP